MSTASSTVATPGCATADIQAAKRLVWRYLGAAAAPESGLAVAVLHPDVAFFGPAPIGRLEGRAAVAHVLHEPLRRTFKGGSRQPQLFLAGEFESAVWVATTGYIVGAMADDWLGVPRGDDVRRLRFGEFYRVDGDRIVEIRCLFDFPGLAAQAGFALLPPFQGRADPPPGPVLGNGIVLDPQDPAETAYTLQLVEDMLGGCNRLDGSDLASMGMAAYWHDDMVWHGPWGVGSCHGFREFQDFAQAPSVSSFPNRRGGFHRARFADGVTACFTGWPSLRGDFTGVPFRGIAPTGGPIGQNIMDFYVRRGTKLHENWILIDLVDFAAQCGIDLLAALPGDRGNP